MSRVNSFAERFGGKWLGRHESINLDGGVQMSSIDVRSEIEIYEVDGKEVELGIDPPKLVVESHWNRDEFVVLTLDGKSVTVEADKLRKAIENATNT